MKAIQILTCLLLLAADIALPLAGATHTTETEVPIGDPPQLEGGILVETDYMPVNQAQEDLMRLVGPPANQALVDAFAAYHTLRSEFEDLSSRGLIQPYRDGLGPDARDGADVLDPDVRQGGFGEWRIIGDNAWQIRPDAAHGGVAGYTSGVRPDGTYPGNTRTLLLSPELDLRTGAEDEIHKYEIYIEKFLLERQESALNDLNTNIEASRDIIISSISSGLDISEEIEMLQNLIMETVPGGEGADEIVETLSSVKEIYDQTTYPYRDDLEREVNGIFNDLIEQVGEIDPIPSIKENVVGFSDLFKKINAFGATQESTYELTFRSRYNLGLGQDGVNVLVFTSEPPSLESWEQGAPIEGLVTVGAVGTAVPIPATRETKEMTCSERRDACWEFVEPMGNPYTDMNSGIRSFSGQTSGWVDYHVDLSNWAEKRVWIGFSFFSGGTPPGYFQNDKLFAPDMGLYGFQLDDIKLEIPAVPFSLRARAPELPTAQIPSSQTGLEAMPTVPSDKSIPVAFDVTNMGANSARVEVTVNLYKGLTTNGAPIYTKTLPAEEAGPGQAIRFDHTLPPIQNLNKDGSKYTVEAQAKNVRDSNDPIQRDLDINSDDNIASKSFNVISFEDVVAETLTQSSTYAGFGEPVTFELPVRNQGNNVVTVGADACGVDLLAEVLSCSGELFSHGDGTLQSVSLDPGAEHTFQWIAKGSVAGQHRIFVRAGTDLGTVPGLSSSDFRTDLREPIRSRYVDTIALDGKLDNEPAWQQAPSPTLPGGGILSILNSDTHLYLAVESPAGLRVQLDDLADHKVSPLHDGGVLAAIDGGGVASWADLQLNPDGRGWAPSTSGGAPITQVAYDQTAGRYEVSIPLGQVATPGDTSFSGLSAAPGDFVGLFLGQANLDSYPLGARPDDPNLDGNGDLVDELYEWQPIRLGKSTDVVSDDPVRRFQFRGLSSGLGIERSPPAILKENFQECPDLGQWVQENVEIRGDRTEKWNCAEYGPDRRLVLYEGLSPDSVCGGDTCAPWSALGVRQTNSIAHKASTWGETYDSGIIHTPPFKIDSHQPYLFIQHQYATESWIVDEPGYAGSLSDSDNYYRLGYEDPNVQIGPGGPPPLTQEMINIMSAGRVYIQTWNEDGNLWGDRVLVRPDGGYTTDEDLGIVDLRLDDQRHVLLSQRHEALHITADVDGIGFWWPTGFQPLYRPLDQDLATGAEFQGSPWSYDRFPLFGTHTPFQGSVVPEETSPPPATVDLFGKTVRLVFDFQRSQGDDARDFGWRIGGIAVADGERFQRDLSIDGVRTGDLLYDPEEIGVGPGSKLPVVVLLSNQGVADLPGIQISLRGTDAEDVNADPLCTHEVEFSVSIAAGESREFEMVCSVPTDREGAKLLLQAEVSSLAGDDFLPNNRRNSQTLYEIRSTPDIAVRVAAEPRVASSSVQRTVTVVVENRGNVPVSDFDVELQMQQVVGVGKSEALGFPVIWHITNELPVNTLLRLDDSRLETEPTVERYQLAFRPPEQGTFEAAVRVVANSNTDPSNDLSVATFHAQSRLYRDDLDQTPFMDPTIITGERSSNGTDDVWSIQGGSYDGSKRLLAGDPLTQDIPLNSSASVLFPDLDLTTVKGASLTLKHRYALEEGFDGARLELSTDNGKTWRALSPRPQPFGDLPEGYPSITMLGTNPLLDGAAEATAIAFTGNSVDLGASEVDALGRPTGWISSEFDLSNHPGLMRWTALDSFNPQGFQSKPDSNPEITASGERQFRHSSWVLDEPLAEGNQRYWWIQDSTGDLSPHSGDTSWWSGTAGSEEEDGGLKGVSTLLRYNFATPDAEDGRRTFLSWWEHRAGGENTDNHEGTGGVFSVQLYPQDSEIASLISNDEGDRDGDFLADGAELAEFGTDPNMWDTDSDGLSDFQESGGPGPAVFFHTDAHQACGRYPTMHLPQCDGGYGTSPVDSDSDNDGWLDGVEVRTNSDPAVQTSTPTDEDGDGLADVWEEMYFGSLSSNPGDDSDSDGANNEEEQRYGSNPTHPDPDHDGIPDGLEIEYGLDPLASDLPEANAVIVAWDGEWVKRELEVTGSAGADRSVRFYYESIVGEDDWDSVLMQNNAGWFIDDVELISYDVDEATGLQSNPFTHVQDDVENPSSLGWEVLYGDWSRSGSPPDRGTVWGVTDLEVPGRGLARVWSFGDESDQGYPHSIDSRLVTPVVDLTTAVGDVAYLSFDHRYGFEGINACRTAGCNTGDTFISALDGGAVEVQIFNETTGAFGPWQQVGAKFRDFPELRLEHIQSDWGVQKGPYMPNAVRAGAAVEESGYSAIEGKGEVIANSFYETSCNDAYLSENQVRVGAGSSFEVQVGLAKWTLQPCDTGAIRSIKNVNWNNYEYSFVFSGDSGGWEHINWDISPIIGKKARFSFHSVTNPSLTHPDTYMKDGQEFQKPYGGWDIANVVVSGNIFQGKPVQARLHLATDGSLAKGEWSIDDIELVGDRYKNNLAIITLSEPEVLADQGETVVFDAQVANLGINPRGALAVAVQGLDADKKPYDLEVQFDEDGLEEVPAQLLPPGAGSAFGPFSLRPGGQEGSLLPFRVNVTLPDGAEIITIRVQVLQANGEVVDVGGKGELSYILPDNEVGGSTFTTWAAQGLTITNLQAMKDNALNIEPGAPHVGEQIQLSSTIENIGTTEPNVIVKWSVFEVKHKGDLESQPGVGKERATLVLQSQEDLGDLPRRGTAVATQSFTPGAEGLYRAVVEYVVGGIIQERAQWEFLVDTSANYYQIDFSQSDGLAGWTDKSPEPDQTHGGSSDAIRFRHDGANLIWGMDAGQIAEGRDYCDFERCVFSVCTEECTAPPVTGLEGIADSPLIDLGRVPQGNSLVTLTHSMRFYPEDGARLEAVPYQQRLDGGFEPAIKCGDEVASFILHPVDLRAYDGVARTVSSPDQLGGIPQVDSNSYDVPERRHPFAALRSDALMMEAPRVEETLLFDLSMPALAADESCAPQELLLVNYTVALRLHAGERPGYADPNGRSDNRDGSHGWQIHSIGVSSIAVDILEDERRFPVLDGAPKRFGFNIQNTGQVQEAFSISLDSSGSTLPDNNWVRLSTNKVTLAAGSTQTIPFEVNIPPDPNLSRGAYTARMEVRSVSSPSIADTIDVVLDLQSNPLPDLSVSLSTDGGDAVTQGSISPVYVTVRNLGQTESKSVRVQLFATAEGGGATPLETLDLDSLCPQAECGAGSRRTLSADWLVPELTGNYTITAHADAEGRLLEERLDNNLANLRVKVTPLKVPDLAVTGLEVGGVAADGFAEEGDLLMYRATIQNLGLADARNVQVQVLADSALLAEETIPVLAAGQSHSVSAFKVGSRGETIALVHVLPDDRELNTDNNQFKQSVRVRGHDLSASLSPARPLLEPGTDATVVLNVHNSGNTVERVVVALEGAQGWNLSVTPSPLFVAPGRNGSASLRIHVPEDAVAGSPDLRLSIAPATNAGAAVVFQSPFEVRAMGGAPRIEQAEKVSTQPGPVRIALNLTSTTNAHQQITLQLSSPGWEHEPEHINLEPLAKIIQNLSVVIPAGTQIGDHIVKVVAVGVNGTLLSQTAVVVDVLEQERVDTAWSEVRTSGPSDVGNQTFHVTLHATNTGNVPIELTLVPTDLGQNASAQALVGKTLDPGSTQSMVLRVDSESDTLAPLFGNVQIWMRRAGSEGLGMLVRTLALPDPAAAPDLHMVGLDLSPKSLRVGDSVHVSAVIENQGVLLSNVSRLHIYLDGALIEDLEVPAISSGATMVVNATWTVQRDGTYSVVALADAGGNVNESAEENNGLSETLEVKDRKSVSGFLERTVPSPVPLFPIFLASILTIRAYRRRNA